MATKLSILKRDLLAAACELGRGTSASKFLVDICAGYGLAHYKLVDDIEKLDSAVENIGADIDFTPRIAEAIKHLPEVSEHYYDSLVRLGIVEVASVTASVSDAAPSSDKDALKDLFRKVEGK